MSRCRVQPIRGFNLPDTGGRCRRCGAAVPRGRRTFCGRECVEQWKLRTQPGYVRRCVARRDRGVCAGCGADCEKIGRIIRWARSWFGRIEWGGSEQRRHATQDALVRWGFSTPHQWEADHIVPVAEGGGECGLDGYRTLCRPCHLSATAALRARLAEQRKRGIK